jgi:HK97 family phage prohead protease
MPDYPSLRLKRSNFTIYSYSKSENSDFMLMMDTPLLKADTTHEFTILKSDNLIIGGYASIEIVDKQNDLITLEALNDAVKKYMSDEKYRNVMSNHSNVQVGEVVEKYRDAHGVLHKTAVDDVGFYVVIKLRDDIEKAKEISRGIRKGTLRSFSIGGQAISKKQRTSDEHGEYNEIDRLELHEVTICEKGINPEAKFDILKMEEKQMSEKLEKALEELNDLMKQVNQVHSEVDDVTKNAEYMDTEEAPDADLEEKADEELEVDLEEKALDEDSTRDYEAGEEVVSGGKPKAAPAALSVAKGLEGADFATLDLSVENVEKAYAKFKAEKMEALAYDSLNKTFETRLSNELSVKKANAERAEYDARTDVAALKEEFAVLRKSLTEKNSEIRKAQEVAMALPDGIPTSIEAAAEMSWDDLHAMVRGD